MTAQRLRIAFLDTTITGVPGSMARYRNQLEGALREFAHDDLTVETIYLGSTREQFEKFPKRLRMWRHHLRCWRSASRIHTSDFDVMHLLDGSFGYVASAVEGNKVVTTVHDVIPRLQMNGVFPDAPTIRRGARWLINRSLEGVARSAYCVAVSQSTANNLKQLGCHPRHGTEVIHNAIDPRLFDETRCDKAQARDRRYLFHLGNNGFYKNRAGAIEVFRRLPPSLNVDLVLAGPPPDEKITSLVEQHKLSDRIRFEINPSESELVSLYRGASVFVFPSLYEGFGWPPLEAMCADCPVVSSDSGSLREVVGEAGIATKYDDYDAMAQSCENLLADDQLSDHYINAGRERIRSFSLERLAAELVAIYRNVRKRNLTSSPEPKN